MSLACTTDKYDELYARWIPGAEQLLDLGKFRPGNRLLDLCGGTGTVSKAALFRWSITPARWLYYPNITLLDLNPRCTEEIVHQVKGDARQIRRYFGPRSFDLVICRQAIAYIEMEDLPLLFEHIAETLTPSAAGGGRFVFNNFRKPRWFAKTYRYNGRRYFEAAGHLGDTVYHLQASPQIGIDATCFRWHPHDELLPLLEPHFKVEAVQTKSSVRYLCTVRK